jgi:hypothetical protein
MVDFCMFQEVSPAAHALAVNVVKRCAEKLRPYLTAEMSAEGPSQSDLQKEYHEIIYDICQQPLHLPLPIVSSTVQELQVFYCVEQLDSYFS